jgi:hypothetical protein
VIEEFQNDTNGNAAPAVPTAAILRFLETLFKGSNNNNNNE